jgi:serine/threonine-protein kinase
MAATRRRVSSLKLEPEIAGSVCQGQPTGELTILPSPLDPSRDLLFGLLALQTGLINQSQLVTAFHAWTQATDCPMAKILAEQGAISAPCATLVEGLVIEHLRRHGNDPERSLAAVGVGRSTRESLAQVGNPELDASLAHVGLRSTEHDGDPERTAAYSFGRATSDGLRFRILRPHAQGGLGAVFVAMDGELHREVALKQILESHADDPVSRQRFLLEAEITGGLEHPGVVPVYGLGSYGDGRPYYAMRFVRGDSLKEAIECFHTDPVLKTDPGPRSLELRKMLRRFVDVCNAIEYAHSRGVLHRDIKPGNVIVGKHGETLVVDWGLAKATGVADPASGERTLTPSPTSGSAETLPGSALGTPAYMSPEQAEGDLEHLGPRSDVYSLGATLHCLLTGRPPFSGDAGEVIQAVRKGKFRPVRATDPAIDRALEAVCKKAMALKAEDRYGSCRALAEDVERWMADLPVTAWREPLSRRALRWARRHRASVQAAAGALVVIAVLATTAAVVVNQARRREEAARTQVTRALANESAAKAESQENLGLARRAVDDYFTKISENALLKRQDAAEVRDLRSLRKVLLEVALDYYNRLATHRSPDPTLRAEQADAYTRVGRIRDEIGSKEAALEAFQQAEAIRTELEALDPDDATRQRELAFSLLNVADALREIGRTDEALKEYARSQGILERLAQANPVDADIQSELGRASNGVGIVLRSLGRSQDALAAFERGRAAIQRMTDARVADARDQGRLATAHSNIGLLLDEMGRTNEAIAALEQGRLIYQRLLDADARSSAVQDDLAVCDNNLGLVLAHGSRLADALAALARGRVLFRRLVEAHPSVTAYRRDLASNHINSGNVHSALSHPALALPEFKQACAILKPMFDTNPSDMETRRNLAATLFNIGDALRATGKFAAATDPAEEACTLLGTVGGRDPFDEFVLACAHDLCADLLDKASRPQLAADHALRERHAGEALAALRRAIAGGYRAIDPNNFPVLRARLDFQLLILDLAFPDDPFPKDPTAIR